LPVFVAVPWWSNTASCTWLYLKDVQEEMTFADDVVTTDGTLLAARGQTVTRALVNRIENLWLDVPMVEPVRVLVS
jgi:hypothetical protein